MSVDAIQIDNNVGMAVLAHHSLAINLDKPKKGPVETIELNYNITDWIPWGDSNNKPKEIFDKCSVNTIIPATLAWKANTVAMGGVRPGYLQWNDLTKEDDFIPFTNTEIKSFMRLNDLQIYCEEALRDMYWWNMAYADFGLNADRTKINNLLVQEAYECRSGVQNPITGLRDFIYISARWPLRDMTHINKQAVIDPYYDVHGQVQNGRDFRYIYPLAFSIPGRKHYQDAPWHSIIFSKWIDIAEKIPILKSKMMDNQMHIKYVVHIPRSWWQEKYKDWDSKPDLKEDRQKDVLAKFNSVLTGINNTGKTLMLTYNDTNAAKDYAKWEINELTQKLSTNDYLEDSAEASLHILFALDVDPTLKGNSPGKQMGAGSGSDKRVAFNIFILNNKPYQDKVTKPLDFISEYNGWVGPTGEPIIWRFNSYLLATEDTKSDNKRM